MLTFREWLNNYNDLQREFVLDAIGSTRLSIDREFFEEHQEELSHAVADLDYQMGTIL